MKTDILLHIERIIAELGALALTVSQLPDADPVIAAKAAKFDAIMALAADDTTPLRKPRTPRPVEKADRVTVEVIDESKPKKKRETKAEREAREFAEQSNAERPVEVNGASIHYQLAALLEAQAAVAPYPLQKLTVEQCQTLIDASPAFDWPVFEEEREPEVIDEFASL